MKPNRSLLSDKRGVSIAVDHALGLFILLLLSGVFVAGVTTTHDVREEAVTEQELDRINDEVAAALIATDTLAENAETRQERAGAADSTYTATRVTLPPSIGGDGYTVSVSESNADGEVTIRTESGGYAVERTITVENDVTAGTASGDVIIRYSDEEITVGGGQR